jgi:hypothetical protein
MIDEPHTANKCIATSGDGRGINRLLIRNSAAVIDWTNKAKL